MYGWYLGSSYQYYKIKSNLKSILKSIESDKSITVTAVDNKNVAMVSIEEISDTFYVYDKTTNEFICQGSTIDEAAENFNKCNINVPAMVTYNNTDLFFINGKAVSTLNNETK